MHFRIVNNFSLLHVIQNVGVRRLILYYFSYLFT